MQMETNANACTDLAKTVPAHSGWSAGFTADIDPRRLASLDFGLFRTLCKLGTSKEKICSALRLSPADYNYIARLEQI